MSSLTFYPIRSDPIRPDPSVGLDQIVGSLVDALGLELGLDVLFEVLYQFFRSKSIITARTRTGHRAVFVRIVEMGVE